MEDDPEDFALVIRDLEAMTKANPQMVADAARNARAESGHRRLLERKQSERQDIIAAAEARAIVLSAVAPIAIPFFIIVGLVLLGLFGNPVVAAGFAVTAIVLSSLIGRVLRRMQELEAKTAADLRGKDPYRPLPPPEDEN